MTTEVCPMCGEGLESKTRGIPSMGTCYNGHTYDRVYSMSSPLFELTGPIEIPEPQKSMTLSEKDWEDIYHIVAGCITGPPKGPRGATTRLFNEIREQMPHIKTTLSTIQTNPRASAIFVERKDCS